MSERRSKVAHNPRVGRQGYAGKAAKLVSVYNAGSCVSQFRVSDVMRLLNTFTLVLSFYP